MRIFFLFVLWSITNICLAGIYRYHPQSRLYLSGGHNPFAPSQGYLVCIDHEGETAADSQGAVATTVEMSLVKSREDFYKMTEFSSTLAGSYLFVEGQANIDMMNEKAFHADSLSWVILFKTDYGRYILKNPMLKDRFRGYRAEDLYTTCGHEIVTEQRKGVMVYALLTVSNLSRSEKSKLETKFHATAKGLIWNVELDARYKSFLSAALSASDLRIKVFALGGRGLIDLAGLISDNGSLLDYHKVPQVLQAYIKQMTPENAVPTQYVTTSLKAFRDDVAELAPTFRKQQVSQLFNKYDEIMSIIKRLSVILGEDHDNYIVNESQIDKLNNARTEYEQAANKVYDQAQNCFAPEKLDKCHLPETNLPAIQWPQQKNNFCEIQRRIALDHGLVKEDFYEMARKRNFVPIFSFHLGIPSVQSWVPCQSKI